MTTIEGTRCWYCTWALTPVSKVRFLLPQPERVYERETFLSHPSCNPNGRIRIRYGIDFSMIGNKFPCPYCKGQGSFDNFCLDGMCDSYKCGFCEGDAIIEVGSATHKELLINAMELKLDVLRPKGDMHLRPRAHALIRDTLAKAVDYTLIESYWVSTDIHFCNVCEKEYTHEDPVTLTWPEVYGCCSDTCYEQFRITHFGEKNAN